MAWKFFTALGAEKRAPSSAVNPVVSVAQSANQALTINVYTVLTWDVETVKTDAGMHSNVTNNTRLTCTVAGKYRVWCSTEATGPANLFVGLLKNGVNIAESGGGNSQGPTVSRVIDLAVGDYVEARMHPGSTSISSQSCCFGMEKVDGAVVTYVGVPGSLVGQEVAYAENTGNASITNTTEATAQVVVTAPSFTADGTSAYWIEFFCPLMRSSSAGAATIMALYDAGVNVTGNYGQVDAPGVGIGAPLSVRRRIVPSAGTHTYSWRAYTSAGTATFFGGSGSGAGTAVPQYIRVTRAA